MLFRLTISINSNNYEIFCEVAGEDSPSKEQWIDLVKQEVNQTLADHSWQKVLKILDSIKDFPIVGGSIRYDCANTRTKPYSVKLQLSSDITFKVTKIKVYKC